MLSTAAKVAEMHAVKTLLNSQVAEGRPDRLLFDKATDADHFESVFKAPDGSCPLPNLDLNAIER